MKAIDKNLFKNSCPQTSKASPTPPGPPRTTYNARRGISSKESGARASDIRFPHVAGVADPGLPIARPKGKAQERVTAAFP